MSDESIIKELKIAKVEPGDIVVVYMDNGELPPHKAIPMMDDMSSRLKEHLPHLEFLVLPYGHSDIKVVRPVPPITPSFQWDGSDSSPMIPFLQRYWKRPVESWMSISPKSNRLLSAWNLYCSEMEEQMTRKTGKKWSTKTCLRCGDSHSGYSGKLDKDGTEYVVCGVTNKRIDVQSNRFRDANGEPNKFAWTED